MTYFLQDDGSQFKDMDGHIFSIPQIIKKQMEKKHMSADDVAKKTGIHRTTIFRLLSGERDMHQSLLFQVMKAVGLKIMIK